MTVYSNWEEQVNCMDHPHNGQTCLENRMSIGLKDYLGFKNPRIFFKVTPPHINRLDALGANALV